jgi:hypothetical protein
MQTQVYELVSGQPMGRVVFEEVRGMDGLKQATINIPLGPDSKCAPRNRRMIAWGALLTRAR